MSNGEDIQKELAVKKQNIEAYQAAYGTGGHAAGKQKVSGGSHHSIVEWEHAQPKEKRTYGSRPGEKRIKTDLP